MTLFDHFFELLSLHDLPKYFCFQGLHAFQVESPIKPLPHALWFTSMMRPTFWSYWNEDIKNEIGKAMKFWNCSYRQRTGKCPIFYQSFGYWYFSIDSVFFPAKEFPGKLGKKNRRKKRKGGVSVFPLNIRSSYFWSSPSQNYRAHFQILPCSVPQCSLGNFLLHCMQTGILEENA